MLRATKVRLYPTAEEVEFLNRQFGVVRFVRNKALAIKVHRYRVHGQMLSAKHDLRKLLPIAKRSRRYAWLADYDSMALQQACIDLDRAFKNFFEGHARFPRFKRKHGEQSSYHCSGAEHQAPGHSETKGGRLARPCLWRHASDGPRDRSGL